MVQIEKPVKEYLVEIQRWGVTHHVIVVHGDIRCELRKLAEIMGVKTLVI